MFGVFVELVNIIKGFWVIDFGGSDMCFFVDYFGWLGFCFGMDDVIKMVDVIVVFDCDILWILFKCKLR